MAECSLASRRVLIYWSSDIALQGNYVLLLLQKVAQDGIPSHAAIEGTSQILKVNCLLDKMTFLGLRPAGLSEQEWFLSLSPMQ